MNILLVDGNEKEASERYTKLGMDTQFQVYEKILKKYSKSNVNDAKINKFYLHFFGEAIKSIDYRMKGFIL